MLDKRQKIVGGVLATLVIIGSLIAWRAKGPAVPVTEVHETPTALVSPTATPDVGWRIKSDKAGFNAPIILDVDGSVEKTYLKAIEKGVAHYKGTSQPGEAGNTVIFGHSSYYKNKPGDYKQVFKQLNLLQKGDPLIVTHDNQMLNYKVSVSKIISDVDFSVIDPTPTQTVTILTCWPPGTIEKRYVIQAERVDDSGNPWPTPTPASTVAPKSTSKAKKS